MKNERQAKIIEIIQTEIIETQEELLKKLRVAGFHVTQATVSRDIRELNLVKGSTPDGRYKYTVGKPKGADKPKFSHALSESIISIDYAQNLIVVKTFAGMAQAVATQIDYLREEEIIGCVAGDDAILVVVKTCERAIELCGMLKDMIGAV